MLLQSSHYPHPEYCSATVGKIQHSQAASDGAIVAHFTGHPPTKESQVVDKQSMAKPGNISFQWCW
jgi:hypothetical protein